MFSKVPSNTLIHSMAGSLAKRATLVPDYKCLLEWIYWKIASSGFRLNCWTPCSKTIQRVRRVFSVISFGQLRTMSISAMVINTVHLFSRISLPEIMATSLCRVFLKAVTCRAHVRTTWRKYLPHHGYAMHRTT